MPMRTIFYSSYASPVGLLDLAASEDGICRLDMNLDPGLFRDKLEDRFECAAVERRNLFDLLRAELEGYFSGTVQNFTVPIVLLEGTPFQRSVWQTLVSIPYGQVRSYGWVARQIGHPRAVRAVGQANGRNPVSILIPCHRVINNDGGLGGYGGGLGMKRALLEIEGYLRPERGAGHAGL